MYESEVLEVVPLLSRQRARQHPWARSMFPRAIRTGAVDAARAPGVAADEQSRIQPPPRGRNAPELISAVLGALATASAAEVAALYGLTRGRVMGIKHRAKLAGADVAKRPTTKSAPVVKAKTAPKPRPVRVVARPPSPPVRPPRPVCEVVAYEGGLTLLDVLPEQCRALDDAGHCCGRVTWSPRSSWCAEHRAAYQAGAPRLRELA